MRRTTSDAAPIRHQYVDGRIVPVDVHFVQRGSHIRFSHSGMIYLYVPLVIDPTLAGLHVSL